MLQGPICENTTLPACLSHPQNHACQSALYQITAECLTFLAFSGLFLLLFSTLSGVVLWAPHIIGDKQQRWTKKCAVGPASEWGWSIMVQLPSTKLWKKCHLKDSPSTVGVSHCWLEFTFITTIILLFIRKSSITLFFICLMSNNMILEHFLQLLYSKTKKHTHKKKSTYLMMALEWLSGDNQSQYTLSAEDQECLCKISMSWKSFQ